ncbi:DUF1015 domain-containing protein [bacterium]|nr:DUF1015 domain-containing protein [bacterium]
MVWLKPFKGLRPKKEHAVQVAAPPYDVLNSEEAREMAKGNPLSFLHVTKPEIDLDPSISLYDDRVYAKGGENLKRLISDGILVQDPKDCFYVYAQRMGTHRQVGLVAGASIDDYEADLIKKHELTRQDKEDDRTRHVDTLNANTGPVFLTYKARPAINELITRVTRQEPYVDFTSADGVQHTFWVVADQTTIDSLATEFKNISHLYVADGHHRSASGCRVRKLRQDKNPDHTGQEEYNFFLSVVFPHDQMQIMPYNRVVKDLNGLTFDQFMDAIKQSFIVKPCTSPAPEQPKQFGLFSKQGWLRLEAKPGSFDAQDPVRSLDVQILQHNVLDPLLGIKDPRRDNRINFVGGIRGTAELEKLVSTGQYEIAFSLYPTTIEQLMAIADAGKIMPPKSTWFEPKLRSGLVTHLLSD